MKWIRFSIAGLMTFILLASLDYAVLRWAVVTWEDPGHTMPDEVLHFLMGCSTIALLAAYSGAGSLRNILITGRCRFSGVAFTALAVLGMGIFASICAFQAEAVELSIDWTGNAVSRVFAWLGGRSRRATRLYFNTYFYIWMLSAWIALVSTLPQLALALLGAWLGRGRDLMIIRRTPAPPETANPS